MTDNRGTEIQTGARVAFNLSGEVALGTIVDPGPDEPIPERGWPRPRRKIKVRLDHAAAGHYSGHISTLTSEKNLVVLP